MTSRGKSAARGFETEIEKSREEGNWKKAVELALQLKARSPQHESLAHFLIGESKLEAYLEECPPSKENWERAERELSEAKGFLTLATDEAGKKAGVALDAHLLLAKLHYACGSCDDALKHYKHAELNTLTEKELPVRSLRIVAESYAIKGLCLEQGAPPAASRYKQHEMEAEMIRSFELASDLTLLYLQRASGAVGGTAGGTTGAGGGAVGAAGGVARAGPALEAALQRGPLLHVRANRLQNAVDRYREMLRAVEAAATQALRLTLARQLAEVLLRGATGQQYRAPPHAPAHAPAPAHAAATLTRRRDELHDGPWKPKKYTGINQFVPSNEYEEVVLLLLVGEAMAVRDAVLSQSAEFEAARSHSVLNAVAVIDLLALVATRWGQLCLVLESLERAMKFSFGCAHVWRQRALVAAAAAPARPAAAAALAPTGGLGGAAPGAGAWGAAVRARGVARRAAALCPQDAPLRLVAANTCYHMGWIEEGIELAQQALQIEEERAREREGESEGESEGEEEEDDGEGGGEGYMLARCCLFVGIGQQMKAQKTLSRVEKEAANEACLQLLLRAVRLDDNDHLAFYHLALQYMHTGMLNEAMDATRSCLQAHGQCGGGLRLATALWSCACAGPRGPRALAAARLARHHYPRAEWPLWALATLQLTWESGEAALATGKELLSLLNSAEVEAEAEHNGYLELDALSDSLHDTHSNRDGASSRVEWTAGTSAARARAQSEGVSSLSGARARAPLAHHRAHAWLTLADLCLRLGRVSAAAGCVSEAAALTPFSHLVLYTRGLVHAASDEWEEARQCFQNALAIHPTHLDSIVQLGAAYYQLGWLRLSEAALRTAAALAPARADTWRRLALVLGALGEPAAAADCAAAALQLQPHAPALPPPPPL